MFYVSNIEEAFRLLFAIQNNELKTYNIRFNKNIDIDCEKWMSDFSNSSLVKKSDLGLKKWSGLDSKLIEKSIFIKKNLPFKSKYSTNLIKIYELSFSDIIHFLEFNIAGAGIVKTISIKNRKQDVLYQEDINAATGTFNIFSNGIPKFLMIYELLNIEFVLSADFSGKLFVYEHSIILPNSLREKTLTETKGTFIIKNEGDDVLILKYGVIEKISINSLIL